MNDDDPNKQPTATTETDETRTKKKNKKQKPRGFWTVMTSFHAIKRCKKYCKKQCKIKRNRRKKRRKKSVVSESRAGEKTCSMKVGPLTRV